MSGRGYGLARLGGWARSLLFASLAMGGVASLAPSLAPALAQQRPQAEGPTGTAPKAPARAAKYMAAAANPLAAEAGREILRQGGSALDAAIAIQMVLMLVEPQSSGIGGGAFLVHYDASKKETVTYDGRETAPAGATPEMFLDAQGKPLPFPEASVGGIAVGTPGVLRMLELAHRTHGRLPWARLFNPAMRLADDGFPISPRLNQLVADTPQLKEFAGTRAYFFDGEGNPRAIGTRLRNPELFETLRTIANRGAEAFYKGAIARDIVAAVVSTGARPGTLSLDDLAGYRAIKRAPVCGPYRDVRVCGMGPPSSGGIAVLETLGILQKFDLKSLNPGSVESVHLIAEALRLAFADRNRYIADADFVPAPVRGLLDRAYLGERAGLISLTGSLGRAAPGRPSDRRSEIVPTGTGVDFTREIPATSHISVVDAAGNAVAMTTSIENAFGSRIMVRGFLLNNQLTDFAFRPKDGETPVANRVERGKRPRSSMSPTIVTDRAGRLVLALGSAGGARIIPFVVQTLVGVVDWRLDIQQAISQPHFTTSGGALALERGTNIAALQAALESRGHTVEVIQLTSGLQGIAVQRRKTGVRYIGGADPRREGVAVGD